MTDQCIWEIVLTKSQDWEYEREYRVVTDPTDADRIPIPPGGLSGIIVGCDADYSAIKRVVDSCSPDVPLRRAVRAATAYQLSIEDAS